MTLTNPEPVVFAEMPMRLAITIAEPQGPAVFASDPDVFAHLKRMQRISAADAPLPGEWQCDHDWGDKNVNRHAVPFLSGAMPKPQNTMHCWSEVPMPDSDYDFTVQCISCEQFDGISVAFDFGSGWK